MPDLRPSPLFAPAAEVLAGWSRGADGPDAWGGVITQFPHRIPITVEDHEVLRVQIFLARSPEELQQHQPPRPKPFRQNRRRSPWH